MLKMSRLNLLILYCVSCVFGSPSSAVTAPTKVIPQCERVSCPTLNCKSPVRTDGQCCAVCPQENGEGHSDPSQCIFNGLLIEHGQTFHPSLLNPQPGDTSNPYCTSCTCSNGYIECKNNSLECPILDCQEPATLPEGTCCPVCPTPSVTTSQATEAPVCRDIDGRTFFEGEHWHPSYPFYGLVTCINCTCVNSKPECVKLPCPVPKEPLPPCGPNEPDIVLCCPTCSRVPQATTAPRQPPIRATTSETIATVTIKPVVLAICPKAYSIKVWKDRQRDALALEDITIGAISGSRVLTIWSWQSVNGSYSYTTTTETVTNVQLTTSYNFIGWTKPARVRRLATATKQQKIERCSSNCHSVLSQLLRVRQDCDGDR